MDSGKANTAPQFPPGGEDVKPQTTSAGKTEPQRGHVSRLPAFPHTHPAAQTHLCWGTEYQDTELGQNDCCVGRVVVKSLVSRQQA